jgi:peptidoglycan/LPS O-acetylase OafA/YrhL
LDSTPRTKALYIIVALYTCFAVSELDRTAPILFWIAFVLYLTMIQAQSRLFAPIRKLGEVFLESKPIQRLGKLSYSTYLVHAPIIQLLVVLLARMHTAYHSVVALVAVTTIPLTLLATYLLHHFVEMPAIAYAKDRFAKSPTKKAKLDGSTTHGLMRDL